MISRTNKFESRTRYEYGDPIFRRANLSETTEEKLESSSRLLLQSSCDHEHWETLCSYINKIISLPTPMSGCIASLTASFCSIYPQYLLFLSFSILFWWIKLSPYQHQCCTVSLIASFCSINPQYLPFLSIFLYDFLVICQTHRKPVANSLANTPIGNTIGSMLTIQVEVFLGKFSSQNTLNKKDMRALTFGFSPGILLRSYNAIHRISVKI